jgi:hypothetical protein
VFSNVTDVKTAIIVCNNPDSHSFHLADRKALVTDGQGRALSGHKTKQAYTGYAKQTLERALPATRKRHAHRLANAERTDIQNVSRNPLQNAAHGDAVKAV